MATWYTSYAACCPKNPNYSKSADKKECTDYSACSYPGAFAGLEKSISIGEVERRNIVAYFSEAGQKGDSKKAQSWWDKNAKGKKVIIKHPTTGKTLTCEVLDTCGNKDCGNCCSKQAKKGGGTLIDLEINTAKRFYGSKIEDELIIDWKWA
jgi:hypothetical protein